MCTNYSPLTAELFCFCYENEFMISLSDDNQFDVMEAINSISRYLDDLMNFDNPHFEVVNQSFPSKLQLNKALFHPKFMINATILILI